MAKRSAFARVLLVGVGMLIGWIAMAQSDTHIPMKFEVASIKASAPVTPDDVAGGGLHLGMSIVGDRTVFRLMPLKALIAISYNVDRTQVKIDSQFDRPFDIIAKLPQGIVLADVPVLLQGLLRERFDLTAHREQRTRQAIALRVLAGGPALKAVSQPGASEPEETGGALSYKNGDADISVHRSGGTRTALITSQTAGPIRITHSEGIDHIHAGAITMKELAKGLSPVVGDTVIDLTGSEGTYEIDFDISNRPPDEEGVTRGAEPTRLDPSTRVVEINKSLSRSGLRLSYERIRMDVIVVDHCRVKPTEN